MEITIEDYKSLQGEIKKLHSKYLSSRRQSENNRKAILKYKEQLRIDAVFKLILKNRNPILYKNIVRKMNAQKSTTTSKKSGHN